MSDPIVGIDLGTTNSLVAYCDESGPRVLPVDDLGTEVMPSVIRYGTEGIEAMGVQARARAIEHPLETIYSVKRLMGRGLQERLEDAQALAYRVVQGPRGLACVETQRAATNSTGDFSRPASGSGPERIKGARRNRSKSRGDGASVFR